MTQKGKSKGKSFDIIIRCEGETGVDSENGADNLETFGQEELSDEIRELLDADRIEWTDKHKYKESQREVIIVVKKMPKSEEDRKSVV